MCIIPWGLIISGFLGRCRALKKGTRSWQNPQSLQPWRWFRHDPHGAVVDDPHGAVVVVAAGISTSACSVAAARIGLKELEW